jgi:flagellar hook protein FlgE
MSAFSIPLSGLAATSSSLNVIANNLANLNTDGFKEQSLSFASVFDGISATSGNGDPVQMGNGVTTDATVSNFSNGNINDTGIPSNMALQGNGFFVVENNGQYSFTRSGDFTVNPQGQLTTPQGQLVMGYPATAGVVSTSSALVPIAVNAANNIPASATTTFTMNTNLNATSAVGATYSAPITVYDSLGESHVLTVNYTNTAANAWTYTISIPAADVGQVGNPVQVTTGNMTFNSSGDLTAPTGAIPGIAIAGLADGASNMTLSWNLAGSGGSSAVTQQAGTSATSATSQNGFATGSLTGYSILPDGTVQGQFTNNQTLALGQVAVASFANNEGLTQTGNSDYQASFASGAAVIGLASTGGRGSITGGAVEGSNVNLSTEFANMIVAQQAYEANAKVLTTLDQVSQATLQVIQ